VFGGLSSILGGDGFKKTFSVIAIVGGVIGIAYAYNAFKK
jgi:hypothetical protein